MVRKVLIVVALMLAPTASAWALDDLILDGPGEGPVYLGGEHEFREVRIVNGALLKLNKNYSGTGSLTVRCSTFTIDRQSRIDGVGQGEAQAGAELPAEDMGGNGGSYGGPGGAATSDIIRRTYGSKRGLDIDAGGLGNRGDSVTSPFGEGVSGGLGGEGGASFKLVGDYVTIDGRINMDGEPGEDAWECSPRTPCYNATAGGGGAGGGVLIVSRQLTISASAHISANGGDGGFAEWYIPAGFGGGGGRIKIFYEQGKISEESTFEVKPGVNLPIISEDPRCADCVPSETGTIWIQQVPSIDNLLDPNADFNNDGIVDEVDLLLLMDQWHKNETEYASEALGGGD